MIKRNGLIFINTNKILEYTKCISISCTESYEYLGVILDSKINWAQHINFNNNKIRKFIFIINKIITILDLIEIKMLNYKFFHLVIMGEILVWRGAYKSALDCLNATQRTNINAAINSQSRY